MRRSVMLALSMSLVLGLALVGRPFAQEEKTKPAAPAPAEAKPAEAAPAPPATIPPEVEAKLEAARKAVAEAIVAAQEAGLVQTSIDPPPVLDILITGRATDATELKKPASERKGVNPEVFGAWFTGYGDTKALPDLKPETDVRIVQPSNGLKTWYDQRATVLNRYLDEARKARGGAEKKEQAKPADEKKEEPKKDEAKPADEKKDENAPKAEEKKEEPKKEEAKPAEEKKDEAKPAEEEKDAGNKSDDAPKDEPKG